MASRKQTAAFNEAKAKRAEALAVLQGQPLPLPTEPRTTPAEPDDQTADEIIALGFEGLADAQIANHLAVSLETLIGWENGTAWPGDQQTRMTADEWAKGCQNVRRALSRARTAAQAWWEESARRALVTENNRFPAGVFAQVMKARFSGYEDKPAVVVDLGQLVVINRRQPTSDRLPIEAKPLTVHDVSGLDASPEARSSERRTLLGAPESQAETGADGG